jgi:hypothetical protein
LKKKKEKISVKKLKKKIKKKIRLKPEKKKLKKFDSKN